MGRNLFILGAILTLVFAYSWFEYRHDRPLSFSNEPSTDASVKANDRKAAPDFTVRDIDGRAISLSSFKGKAVVLNFWASWCAPCTLEFPQMLNLAKDHQDTVFVFLSQDDSHEDMLRFIRKLGKSAKLPNVHIARDEEKAVAQLYATYKLPETYLLTPRHDIAEKIIGFNEAWDSKPMREKISTLSATE